MCHVRDVVLERTHRGHPSTQPYNQVAAEEAVDLGKPASIFDLSGMDYTDDELPHFSPVVWVRGAAEPTIAFVLLLWHGPTHAGDMTSWILEFTRKGVNPYPIDLVIGRQEHNLMPPAPAPELQAPAQLLFLHPRLPPKLPYQQAVRREPAR